MGRAPKKVGTPGSYNLAATKKKKKHHEIKKTKKLTGKKKKVGCPTASAKKGSARKNNYRNDFMLAASLF
jgi:hypothetical protein